MEYLYSALKKLEVISISDGKNLGKICDISLFLPEGKLKGFFVTGCKGFKFNKSEVFIPLGAIVKIGEDALLVKIDGNKKPTPCPPPNGKSCPPPPDSRRDFDDYE